MKQNYEDTKSEMPWLQLEDDGLAKTYIVTSFVGYLCQYTYLLSLATDSSISDVCMWRSFMGYNMHWGIHYGIRKPLTWMLYPIQNSLVNIYCTGGYYSLGNNVRGYKKCGIPNSLWHRVHFWLSENWTGSTFGGAKTGPGPLLVDKNWTEYVFDSDGSQQTITVSI